MTDKDKYIFHADTEKIKSSLQFSKNDIIAEYFPFESSSSSEIRVCGEVKIEYKGTWYSDYNQFPQELKNLIDRGVDPYTIKDCYVDMSNWFEVFVEINGETYGDSWIVDIENTSHEKVREIMKEHYEYVKDEYLNSRYDYE